MGRKIQPVFKRVLGCFDSKSEFARQVGESRQVVNAWLRRGSIPAEYAIQVAQATHGVVAALDLVVEANRERVRRKIAREEMIAARNEAKAVPAEGA